MTASTSQVAVDEDELEDELDEELDDDEDELELEDDDEDEPDELEVAKPDDEDSTERFIFGVAIKTAVSEMILHLSVMTNVFVASVISTAANEPCQRRMATFLANT